MTVAEPERRIEPVSSQADVDRYEALIGRGVEGIIDDWYLERLDYRHGGDGDVSGTARFRKVVHIDTHATLISEKKAGVILSEDPSASPEEAAAAAEFFHGASG